MLYVKSATCILSVLVVVRIQGFEFKWGQVSSDWTANGGWISTNYRSREPMIAEWLAFESAIYWMMVVAKDYDGISTRCRERLRDDGMYAGRTKIVWDSVDPAPSSLVVFIRNVPGNVYIMAGGFTLKPRTGAAPPAKGKFIDGRLVEHFPQTTFVDDGEATTLNFNINIYRNQRPFYAYCDIYTSNFTLYKYVAWSEEEGEVREYGDELAGLTVNFYSDVRDTVTQYNVQVTLNDSSPAYLGVYKCEFFMNTPDAFFSIGTTTWVAPVGQADPTSGMGVRIVCLVNNPMNRGESTMVAGEANAIKCETVGQQPTHVSLTHNGTEVNLSSPVAYSVGMAGGITNLYFMQSVSQSDAGQYVWTFESDSYSRQETLDVAVMTEE